jgi:glycosyltransferase involved in cell wall biosynthesis
MDPIKNLDTLIQAFIDKGSSEYQLVLAGDYTNNHGMQLRNMAQENENIIFVGPVMGDDKEHLLAHSFANCLVSSSEGMPLSLLEAMSYSKPCIVSDIPAIREVLKDDWGQWCTAGDVNSLIEQMARVEARYNEVIEKCPNMSAYVLNNHTWDRIAERYTSYILSL